VLSRDTVRGSVTVIRGIIDPRQFAGERTLLHLRFATLNRVAQERVGECECFKRDQRERIRITKRTRCTALANNLGSAVARRVEDPSGCGRRPKVVGVNEPHFEGVDGLGYEHVVGRRVDIHEAPPVELREDLRWQSTSS
jgi:hypothetical protein